MMTLAIQILLEAPLTSILEHRSHMHAVLSVSLLKLNLLTVRVCLHSQLDRI